MKVLAVEKVFVLDLEYEIMSNISLARQQRWFIIISIRDETKIGLTLALEKFRNSREEELLV